MSVWLDVGKRHEVYLSADSPRLGGSGIVRKGYWDGDESHPVAVKCLAPIEGRGLSTSERKWLYENSVRRFEWERTILFRLNRLYKKNPMTLGDDGHWVFPQPFPRYYGQGIDRKLGRFFVMEWCEPVDVHGSESGFDFESYALGICGAVDWLHRHGFVHCDLKPGNVMRRIRPAFKDDDPPGQDEHLKSAHVMLVDFGSVHKLEEPLTEGELRRAAPGTLSVMTDGRRYFPHTPGFADPLAERHTVHADIYSIGQTLREMFDDEIPADWSFLINRCTCRRYERRFQSVGEIAVAIGLLEERRRKIFDEFRDEKRHRELMRQKDEYEGLKKELSYGMWNWVGMWNWDDVLEKGTAGGEGQPVYWTIKWYSIGSVVRIKGHLVLPKNVILLIEHGLFVVAAVRGKTGSAVVVRDGATFHNCAAADAEDAQEVYVLCAGTYLNFPKIAETEWERRKKVEERVFQSPQNVARLAFHGIPTQYGVRERELARVRATCLPDSFREVLARWFETPGQGRN